VNCEFCGSPSLHGAKLCAACRSALKRARHDPVSVLDALQKSKSATRRRNRQKDTVTTLPPMGATPPRRRGPAPAVVGGILAILCLLTYGLLQHLDGSARAGLPVQVEANAPVDATAQSSPAMPTPATDPAPAGTDASLIPPSTQPPQSMPDSVEPLPVEPSHVVAPRPKHKAPPAPPAPPVEVIMPTIPAPAPEPPPPPPKPAPPPTRESQLAAAFAACTSSDALEKAICQQRARVDFCEGYWGLVPQCPARRESGS
jgi:hypothetical protein